MDRVQLDAAGIGDVAELAPVGVFAEEAYQDMRQRKNERGATKEAITTERDAAQAELEAALKYLEVELPEEARQGDALPGWLRGEE